MVNNKSYVVYRHTAPNGKMYIGITSKPPSYRWDFGRGYITNQHFIRAINKYGWNNIKHDILLENLTAEEVSLAEEIFIHYWDLTNPNNGYNHETGGIKNFTVSDETRRRLSIACSGEKNGMYGKKHTKESKQKMSESSKNKPNPMKGKHHTIETKEKMSKAKRGKKLSQMHRKHLSESHRKRKVDMFDKQSGEYLQSFNSILDASKTMNINYSTITNCCRGVYKTAGGYLWKYKEK